MTPAVPISQICEHAVGHIVPCLFIPPVYSDKLTIAAPTKASPSMAMAIENYINGKGQDEAVISRPSSLKKDTSHKGTTSISGATKKPKSVFANKAKYKQLQEERKAQAAARRAERQAAKEAQIRAMAEKANIE